jgi:hypothetical protein
MVKPQCYCLKLFATFRFKIRASHYKSRSLPVTNLFSQVTSDEQNSWKFLNSNLTHKEVFKFNSQVHKFNARSIHDLYYHQANLTQFQKGICYMGVKICNHLPPEIKSMSNETRSFKAKLTTFLLQNCFYTIEEFFELKYN